MSSICCLTASSNLSFNTNLKGEAEDSNSTQIILDQHTPSKMIHSHSVSHPLVLLNEENEVSEIDRMNENAKLIFPRSSRSLKRRPSLLEKSRDWARRLMTLHRNRRNTISNEKLRNSCYDFHRASSIQKNSHHSSLHHDLQSFDEDGYLSPMEIKAKLDHLAREKNNPNTLLSKSSGNVQTQLIVYSHSSSDISQQMYRCDGTVRCLSTSKCTCQQQQQEVCRPSVLSDFHRSLSNVDYIDDDDLAEECSSKPVDFDDPLLCLRYLFNEDDRGKSKCQQGNVLRRTMRRSTNTSSISTDSGYCDLPNMTSSKLIPVHLISCTLIPVNVTRTDPIDSHCLACTCTPSSTTMYTNNSIDYEQQTRQRRKSSTNSSRTQLHRIVAHPQKFEFIDNVCSCNQKYYSTMNICPNFNFSSTASTRSITLDDYPKDQQIHSKQTDKKHLRKKRTQASRFPIVSDDLVSVSRWYKPHLDRDVICQALQQADYGAFILRDSTTHVDCYALSVKVPKFTHDSNIAHYLIEKVHRQYTYHYRIKGTTKEFPTLLSLLTHHSVMPEILPITLNLQQTLAI